MKAIIKVAPHEAFFETARAQLAALHRAASGEPVNEADYVLCFETASLLFSHLTRSRLGMLDRLRKMGPCSVYALAKAAGRNYSNVHRDVAALEEEGLIERNEAGQVFTPFDKVEIHLDMAQAA